MSEVLATAESIAKIVSSVAVPIAIAVGGWLIQRSLSRQSIQKDYVSLAVSILQKPEKEDLPVGLREWAASLLNENSPTKFSSKTLEELKTGKISLAAIGEISRIEDALEVVLSHAQLDSLTKAELQALDALQKQIQLNREKRMEKRRTASE